MPEGPASVKHVALNRIDELVNPTEAELDAFEQAKAGRREYKRKETITRQGDRVSEIYLLANGWVAGNVEVDLVRTQLVKVNLPGDILGLPNATLSRAAVTLTAITDATVDVIPLEALGRLFEVAPRLAFALFLTTQQERLMLMDQLSVVGQTSALQRLAALLLHIHRRLSVLDAVDGDTFDWPLSQELVGQAAGLTAIHVNRTFRDMKRAGLIASEGKRMRLLDTQRLTEIAGVPERSFVRKPSWLASLGGGGNKKEAVRRR
jgi:CRP/FNR family transcriptional regulator, anaerobic regulatory protein